MPNVTDLSYECVNGCGQITETEPKKIFDIWKTGIIECPICGQKIELKDGKYKKI